MFLSPSRAIDSELFAAHSEQLVAFSVLYELSINAVVATSSDSSSSTTLTHLVALVEEMRAALDALPDSTDARLHSHKHISCVLAVLLNEQRELLGIPPRSSDSTAARKLLQDAYNTLSAVWVRGFARRAGGMPIEAANQEESQLRTNLCHLTEEIRRLKLLPDVLPVKHLSPHAREEAAGGMRCCAGCCSSCARNRWCEENNCNVCGWCELPLDDDILVRDAST